MSVHDLEPITALGHAAPCIEHIGGRSCHEVDALALASVAARLGKEADCVAALSDLIGAAPPTPGKAVLRQPYSAFWMGPEQWMITADFPLHEDIADQAKSALGHTASVTEQTDAWCCFDLKGTDLDAVLELLCNVNTPVMQAGDATRTSIHHLGCFVLCLTPQQHFRLLGPRASAESLFHAIITAMTSAAPDTLP